MLAPAWALYPMVVLATWATVIASQAVISGAFSLTPRRCNSGTCRDSRCATRRRRRWVRSISPRSTGCCSPALSCWSSAFKSSSNLAAAYGIAVSGTMAITAVLAGLVARRRWGWPPALVVVVFGGISRHRPHLFLRQRTQDLCRRLVPHRPGGRGVRPDVDLAPGPRGHVRTPVPQRSFAALIPDQPVASGRRPACPARRCS